MHMILVLTYFWMLLNNTIFRFGVIQYAISKELLSIILFRVL